jgi:hypothetical protein
MIFQREDEIQHDGVALILPGAFIQLTRGIASNNVQNFTYMEVDSNWRCQFNCKIRVVQKVCQYKEIKLKTNLLKTQFITLEGAQI